MKCNVKGIYKNLRYRILMTEEEYYIVDMGQSYMKVLFPFLFWMFTTPAYKLNDLNILDELKNPKAKQQSDSKIGGGNFAALGGSIGFLIALSLKPLGDYLLFPDTLMINTIILAILVLSVLAFLVFINNKSQKDIYRIVNLGALTKEKIWIRPKSIKHFLQVIGSYLFVLILTVVFFYLDVQHPDIVTQLFTVAVLFFYLISHFVILAAGQNIVEFKSSVD